MLLVAVDDHAERVSLDASRCVRQGLVLVQAKLVVIVIVLRAVGMMMLAWVVVAIRLRYASAVFSAVTLVTFAFVLWVTLVEARAAKVPVCWVAKNGKCRFINIARISMKFRRDGPHRADTARHRLLSGSAQTMPSSIGEFWPTK